MMKGVLLLAFIFIFYSVYSQDVDSTKSPSGTSLILYTNWSSTYRSLKINEGLFGKPIAERADEKSASFWSYGIGFQSRISNHFTWEGGIALQRNGEKYSFEEKDTLYSYTSRYSYISMPIKLYYKTGKAFKLIAGVGIVPQIFLGYKQNVNWKNKNGVEGSGEIKETIGYNSFVLSSVFNLGVELEMNEKWGVFILPEYRIQLTNGYGEKKPYKHFARAIGLNMGLVINI